MLGFNLTKFDLYFEQLLINNGVSTSFAHLLNTLILCAIIVVLAIVANYITKKIIIKIIKRYVDKSNNNYDDIFYEKGVFNKLSHLAPALIISYLSPLALKEYPGLISFISTATSIYMIVVVLLVINSIINALQDIYNGLPVAKDRSIKGYVQVVKTIIFFVGGLMVISILVKKDLSSLFAGLTAFAAVLMFVFKDAILGLIAGIQMSSNDILRVGDYIEMPQRNADGTVIDISLSTVKVHNTNKTISTIPTYAFVTESFWNWRGLEASNGRRIKRTINIDMRSIALLSDSLLKGLKKNEKLTSFFAQLGNQDFENTTNLGLFRKYIEFYLKGRSDINTEMNFMVRHMQPNENGLPLEIYIYTKPKDGPTYEAVQAEVFEHVIAMSNFFEVKLLQRFTGENK